MSLIQTLYDLELEQTELLYRERINDEWFVIRQYDSYRWLSIGGDMIQSLMDLNHPEQLLLPNLKTLLACLDIAGDPASCLNVGSGAGCIDRYLNHHLPAMELTSLESNKHVIHLANKYFNMPAEYCVESDIESYLQQQTGCFDIILFDIYSDEKNPACLYSEKFYKKLSSVMADECVLAFNLLPESEEDLLAMLKPLNNYVHALFLHEVPNHNNVIIYAVRDKQASLKTIMESVQILAQQDILIDILSQHV